MRLTTKQEIKKLKDELNFLKKLTKNKNFLNEYLIKEIENYKQRFIRKQI